MDKNLVFELIGYAASLLIAVSMMMSSILRLRILNTAGAAAFALYGLLIHAYPVAVLNGLIVIVNAYFLFHLLHTKEYFQLLKLKHDSAYLPYFLNFYREDIQQILPDFQYQPTEDQIALFILRDCSPVGAFIAHPEPDGVLRVVLDFVIPRYRDVKIGRFLFVEHAEFFRERGVREIVIAPRTKQFGAYLVQVGFEPANRNEGSFRIRYSDKAV